MIKSKEDLAFYLREDAKANIKRETCSWLRMQVNVWYGNDSYRFLQYMQALRKYEYALNCLSGPVGKFRRICAKVRFHKLGAKINVNILPNVVGYGFRVPHLVGGVIINCKSVGCKCTANAGVIVGNNNKGGMAVIGDNVDLCVGCKVIGGVHIGNNVIVGAGALIKDQNIPDNCIVFGQSPNLIIKSKK